MDRLFRAGILCLLAVAGRAQTPLEGILIEEIERNFRVLVEKGNPPPYFVAYDVTGRESCSVTPTLGATQAIACSQGRYLDVTVRAGSAKLDNYHRVPGDNPRFTSAIRRPIEDHAEAIKQRIRIERNRACRQASERLIKIRTGTQVKLAGQDAPAGFSSEEPASFAAVPVRLNWQREGWEDKARKWCALCNRHPEILTSSVTAMEHRDIRWFVNTEGTRLQHGRGLARLSITAQAVAADGMNLMATESFEDEEPECLPHAPSVRDAVERVNREILIEEIRRQGKPYGLYFSQVAGGYTQTRRGGLQAFTVIPIIVYRVHPDGRPDELVRWLGLQDFSTRPFRDTVAAGDDEAVFDFLENGALFALIGARSHAAESPVIAALALFDELRPVLIGEELPSPTLLPPPAAAPGGAVHAAGAGLNVPGFRMPETAQPRTASGRIQ